MSPSHLYQSSYFVSDPDCYVVVKCEGVTLKSSPVKNSLNPEWNYSVILYRHKPERGYKVQVWRSNLIVDQCIGEAVLKERINPFQNSDKEERNIELYNRGKKQFEKVGGSIKLVIESSNDTTQL